jgi:methyltransferase (TIGR00027 family)
MTEVSRTAYWAAGVRREDASKPKPICNDHYSHLFLDAEGERAYEAAKHLERPAVSLLVRHRLIGDVIRREVEQDTQKTIVILGAGFDTQSFRIQGGRWLEVDTPEIIQRKNECLPVSDCKSPLKRIAIDFQKESLVDKLKNQSTEDPVLIVVEGVLMYLSEPDVRDFLCNIKKIFPRHRLVCDLMNKLFLEKFTKELNQVFTQMGAPFRWMNPYPEKFVEGEGYRLIQRESVVGYGHDLGFIKMPPRFIRALFLKGLFEGSHVCLFETQTHSHT